MPLWKMSHPVAAFAEPRAKAWLAGNITQLYVAIGLPAFYLNVFFRALSGESLFVGGIPAATPMLEKPFMRFSIQHIAIHNIGNDEAAKSLVARLGKVSATFPAYTPLSDRDFSVAEPYNPWRRSSGHK